VENLEEKRVCCVLRIDYIREPIFEDHVNLAFERRRHSPGRMMATSLSIRNLKKETQQLPTSALDF
jgi:hypothetical protein